MSTEYQLRIYSRAGTLTAVVVDFLRLAYRHQRNAPGILEFEISPTHPAVALLELDGLVECWRRTADLDWYVEFAGFYRWQQQGLDENGRAWLLVRCPGLLHLVGRALVAYRRGLPGLSAFVAQPAETIIKALVSYNCTALGSIGGGRLRDVTLDTIQLEADAGRGNALDFECSLQNVLASCQQVAAIGGGDFVMSVVAAATYEFAWRAASTSAVVFAPNMGNMTQPVLTRNWIDTRTVAIAGGPANTYAVVEGAEYVAAYQDAEMYVYGAGYTTTAGLEAAAETALEGQKATELEFAIIQAPQALYGVDYEFLDWVTVRFSDVELTMQIQEVGVTVDNSGQETIEVVCRE